MVNPRDICGSKEWYESYWGALILRRIYTRLDHEAEEISRKFRYDRRWPQVSEEDFRRRNLLSSALNDIEELYFSEFWDSKIDSTFHKDFRTKIYNISTDAGSGKFLPFTKKSRATKKR